MGSRVRIPTGSPKNANRDSCKGVAVFLYGETFRHKTLQLGGCKSGVCV
ncbi:hypothetical protein MTBLM5_370012 [Magnetospirillum sp. LM-5]|nr:hypothetical protein MTBLM5_370012 [Magnetospirillum sp. LM-5]